MLERRTVRVALLCGLVLMALGLERLVSAYLIGAQAATWSTRVIVGGLCCTAGGLSLAALLYPGDADVCRGR